MQEWWEKIFASCELGDLRLNKRACEIGKLLSQGFGQALSESFPGSNALKQGYEFLPTARQSLAS